MVRPWQEHDARRRQDSLDQARAHLGDEQLERAYAQGMALGFVRENRPQLFVTGDRTDELGIVDVRQF
jgi:hypothetical protein